MSDDTHTEPEPTHTAHTGDGAWVDMDEAVEITGLTKSAIRKHYTGDVGGGEPWPLERRGRKVYMPRHMVEGIARPTREVPARATTPNASLVPYAEWVEERERASHWQERYTEAVAAQSVAEKQAAIAEHKYAIEMERRAEVAADRDRWQVEASQARNEKRMADQRVEELQKALAEQQRRRWWRRNTSPDVG